ncbi:hypothetical protein CDO87_26155 (plasmid) [Sagittula sp. P11]|nr:hypothetical protein CDO87_26155 [Sagittula sp. P11]
MFPSAFGGVAVEPSSRLCLEGAARSGNTFSSLMIHAAWPELKLGHHTHCLSNIREAVRYGVPTIVLFRSPKDCVPSSMLRQNMKFGQNDERHLMRALVRFIRIYSYALEKIDDIYLIDFKDMTAAPEKLLFLASEQLDALYVLTEEEAKGAVERARAASPRMAQQDNGAEKAVWGGFTPDERREEAKLKVRELLETKMAAELSEAMEIFERCMQKKHRLA